MANLAHYGLDHRIEINAGEGPPPVLRNVAFDFQKMSLGPSLKRFPLRTSAINNTLFVTELHTFPASHRYSTVGGLHVELAAKLPFQDFHVVHIWISLRIGRSVGEGPDKLLGCAVAG